MQLWSKCLNNLNILANSFKGFAIVLALLFIARKISLAEIWMIAAETAGWDMSIIWPYGKKKENSQIFNDDF